MCIFLVMEHFKTYMAQQESLTKQRESDTLWSCSFQIQLDNSKRPGFSILCTLPFRHLGALQFLLHSYSNSVSDSKLKRHDLFSLGCF